MDSLIATLPAGRDAAMADIQPLMPPEARLAMPAQSLTRQASAPAMPAPGPDASTLRARIFVFGLTLALTAFGTEEIIAVVSPAGATWLQVVFAALFAVTFAWIAFPAASATLGFWRLATQGAADAATVPHGPLGRNALVMPVYNENPTAVFAALAAMAGDLVCSRLGSAFDIVILSDTRDHDIAEAEMAAARRLGSMMAGRMAVYYRRRADNRHRKAGNIADFVARWGGRYDHMVVLDADSTMTAETLAHLARAMAADPAAGIIQTLPALTGRLSLFARMQQFAGRVYGPVVAAGIAAWHGRDGNYWGHNAIIRVRAFAAAAGLPELPGRKPFGGHILSHDFIEAAFMRRAGWAVYMLPELEGSFEQSPPNLIDLAARDRRWAQGNLQHMKVISASGLHWMSRLHLLQGIMSYLASPLWLALILIGLGLSLQARFVVPDYFPNGLALFPTWPIFDPARALRLFGFTMAVLLLPKFLGTALILADRRRRSDFGGSARLAASLVTEIVLSSLIAPVMMLVQTIAVASILMGRDAGWATQNRDDGSLAFENAWYCHAGHMIFGLLLVGASAAVSVSATLWMAPIAVGLVLAPPLTWLTASPRLGCFALDLGLFAVPEELSSHDRTPVRQASG